MNIERLIEAQGDWGKLSPGERRDLYREICETLDIEPNIMPFYLITTQGRGGGGEKTILYLNRGGAEALRKKHHISVRVLQSSLIHLPGEGLFYQVVVEASMREPTQEEGKEVRREQGVAVADLRDKQGVELENAILFAETKAKRRATISLLGLGSLLLDETEALSIPIKSFGRIDMETGEIQPLPQPVSIEAPREEFITRETLAKLSRSFKRLRTPKEMNRAIAEALVGREVKNSRQLLESEGKRVMEFLQGNLDEVWRKIGKLLGEEVEKYLPL